MRSERYLAGHLQGVNDYLAGYPQEVTPDGIQSDFWTGYIDGWETALAIDAKEDT
jgi:hypothetical protein